MKSTLYSISLVILTLVITVVFSLGGTALATKTAPAPGKTVLEKSHGNDYVVLAAAKKPAAKKAAPKKKK